MRLATYSSDSGPRAGLVIDEAIIDMVGATGPDGLVPGGAALPAELAELFRAGSDAMRTAQDLADAAVARGAAALLRDGVARPLSEVRLLPPIPVPGKIIALGLNYRDHAAESEMALPAAPEIFTKYSTSLIGHGAGIEIPTVTEQVDYEIELGVVIGRVAKNVPVEHALEYVGGYTVVNDVSMRDYQSRTTQWSFGKSFDRSSPVGPWIVTADEIGDPQKLELELSIDGEVLQHAGTDTMIFPVAEVIAYLSTVLTLLPGDLIATGTPAGVGVARSPQRWLRVGETVVARITGIGELANPVVAASPEPALLP